MPTGYIDPVNPDVQIEWDPVYDVHWSRLNDGVRQPTAPSTLSGTYISASWGLLTPWEGGLGVKDILNMSSISGVDVVSNVKIWMYGQQSDSSVYVNVELLSASNSTIAGPVSVYFSSGGYSSYSWSSANFDLNIGQSALDDLRVSLKSQASSNPSNQHIWIFALYGEVTYSNPVIGDSLGWAFGF